MIRRKTQLIVFVLLLIFILFFVASASGNVENKSTKSQNSVNDTYPLSPIEISPQIIDCLMTRPDFLSFRGTIPAIDEGYEGYKWSFSLMNEAWNISELEPYMQKSNGSGGAVVVVGAVGSGYIEVKLNSTKYKIINESFIDEIYQIINVHYNKYTGISNVPVVFLWDNVIESQENINEIDNTNDINEEKQIPGFTFMMLFIELIILFQFKFVK